MWRLLALVGLLGLVGCTIASAAPDDGRSVTYVQANIAGGWAEGATAIRADGVVRALAEVIRGLDVPPRAVFLNEACERHGADLASLLGPGWRSTFVRAWDGVSSCDPAPGSTQGRFGNAVLVRDASARPFGIPSCRDDGATARCIPNWPPPAEQRRASCVSLSPTDEVLCSVHLDPVHWSPHDAQLEALGRIAGELTIEHRSVVIGGDLNDGPDAVDRATGGALVDATALTYPAATPSRAIDHVLATHVAAWEADAIDLGRCDATHLPHGRCSDHRALVVTMVLG